MHLGAEAPTVSSLLVSPKIHYAEWDRARAVQPGRALRAGPYAAQLSIWQNVLLTTW